jgi:hypothetical protein
MAERARGGFEALLGFVELGSRFTDRVGLLLAAVRRPPRLASLTSCRSRVPLLIQTSPVLLVKVD